MEINFKCIVYMLSIVFASSTATITAILELHSAAMTGHLRAMAGHLLAMVGQWTLTGTWCTGNMSDGRSCQEQ